MGQHNRFRYVVFGVLTGCAFGCADGGQTGDRGDDGKLGGEECEVVSTTPVGWNETTELGTPAAAFGDVSGSCTAAFEWDGSGSSLALSPERGSGLLTATVAVREGSARWVEQRESEAASGLARPQCDPFLEIDAAVTLVLEDAELAREVLTPVRFDAATDAPRVQVDLTPAMVEDWLTITAPADTTVTLATTLGPIGSECAGEMALTSQTSEGNRGEGSVMGSFASWSDTPCGMGETAVALTGADAPSDLVAALASAFGDFSAPASWDDESSTTVHLEVTTAATVGCARTLESFTELASIPVELTLWTDDGRLVDFDAAGELRAVLTAEGLRELQFTSSATLPCAGAATLAPYPAADCAEVATVEVSLVGTHYPTEPDTDGGLFEAYIFLRESAAAPGAADSVSSLRW